MDAECAGNRRKLIFTKYLHQVSCLLNACVHLTAVYPVRTTCASVIIQYNITTSPLLLSTSHNVYTCHSPKYHYIIVTVVYLVYCITAVCVSWFCDHRAYISDEYVVSMDAGCARNRRKLIF